MKEMKKWIWVILLCGALLLGCKKSPQPPVAQTPSAPEEKAQQLLLAPDFELSDQDGKIHRLSDYRGKVVVLEWFNPDCPFVKRHHVTKTTMVDLAKKYAQNDVVWLAINTTHYFNVEKNKQIATEWNIPYPILDDKDGKVGKAYGATRTPEMFIISPEGAILYHGAIDDDPKGDKDAPFNYVQAALDAILSGNPIAQPRTAPYGCTVKYAR